MDDVVALASVSKPTVYNHFTDKERFYRYDRQGRCSRASRRRHAYRRRRLGSSTDRTRREFIAAIMHPQMLRTRRLVIANADRFPEVGRSWYERGFERVLATLAACFGGFADRGLLKLGDPLMAANHFVGLLLWIPVNRAMFTGNHRARKTELDHSSAAVRAFLDGYRFAPDGKEPIERLQRRLGRDFS